MTATKRRPKTKRGQEPMLVRIFPRDPKRGYHASRFQLRGSGYPIFKVDRGWYEVDPEMAESLRKYHNRNNDPQAKPIFQICTRDQAVAVEEAEQEAIRRADANTPVPLPGAHARKSVDWDADMGGDEAGEAEPVIKKDERKFIPMSELDVDDDEDDEDEFEDPPEVDLLGELDEDEGGDLTTADLKPKSTRRRAAKKKVTKKAPAKKKATKKKTRRRASTKGK